MAVDDEFDIGQTSPCNGCAKGAGLLKQQQVRLHFQ
eukprot:gene5915-14535_t